MLDLCYIERMESTRGSLLELRRDLRVLRENIDLRSAPVDRYDDMLELDALSRRLSTAIAALNAAIRESTKRREIQLARAKAQQRDAQEAQEGLEELDDIAARLERASPVSPSWSRYKRKPS
jgi:seryl-tRNA synthetase